MSGVWLSGTAGPIRVERVGRGDCRGAAADRWPARGRGVAVCGGSKAVRCRAVSSPSAPGCRRHRCRVVPAGARGGRAPAPWPDDPGCAGWRGRRGAGPAPRHWPAGQATPAAATARQPGATTSGRRRMCWAGSARYGPRSVPDGSDNADAMPMAPARQSEVWRTVFGYGHRLRLCLTRQVGVLLIGECTFFTRNSRVIIFPLVFFTMLFFSCELTRHWGGNRVRVFLP